MKKFLPVLVLGAVVAAIALWPQAKTAAPSRSPSPRASTIESAPESDAWARFAEAAARRISGAPPSGGRIRAALTQESFELTAADVPEALALLGEDLEADSMFRLARELNRAMTADQAKAAAAILRTAPGRAVALHALLGRREVREEVVDFFLHDVDPNAQSTAAFLLQEIPEALPPEVLDAARANVRNAPDELRVNSMELLAAAGLTDADTHLIAAVPPGASAEVRIGAARALAAGHADPAVVRPLLESLAADPSLPAETRRSAAAALQALR